MRNRTTEQSAEQPAGARLARDPWRFALVATVLVVLIDQFSKTIAVARLRSGPIHLIGNIHFRLVANSGAFMGAPAPTWLLFGVTAGLALMVVRSISETTTLRTLLGYSMFLGGALGNLVDRVQHRSRFPNHAVVDWISTRSGPTFNLADAAILAGIVVLFTNTRSARPDTAPGADGNHISQFQKGDKG